jgi:hypothetical protein
MTQYAMNKFTATKTKPVTYSVMSTVKSTIPQLDANSVNVQGLNT